MCWAFLFLHAAFLVLCFCEEVLAISDTHLRHLQAAMLVVNPHQEVPARVFDAWTQVFEVLVSTVPAY